MVQCAAWHAAPRTRYAAPCTLHGVIRCRLPSHGGPLGPDTVRESLGAAHRPHAAHRADAALRRPAPRPRSDEPAGVRHAAAARLAASRSRSAPSRRSITSCRPTASRRALRRRHGRAMTAALERNCREFGIRLFGLGERRPGHRARHRPRARPDPAGHDDRVRRQPHVDARRVRRGRVRHRHLAGARRARVAVPGDGAAARCAASRSTAALRPASTPRT